MDSGKTITENYRQVYSEMLKIDIPKLIRDAAAKISEVSAKTDSEKFDITTLLKNEAAIKYKKMGNLTILSRNYETLFLRCG
jgi:hypothetical protein